MKLRIGTRGSELALVQTNWVASELRAAHPDIEIDEDLIEARVGRGIASLPAFGVVLVPPEPHHVLALGRVGEPRRVRGQQNHGPGRPLGRANEHTGAEPVGRRHPHFLEPLPRRRRNPIPLAAPDRVGDPVDARREVHGQAVVAPEIDGALDRRRRVLFAAGIRREGGRRHV